jgi:hypothetical protein
MGMEILSSNMLAEFTSPEFDAGEMEPIRRIVNDQPYFDYLSGHSNGGFYFGGSLHLYGVCKRPVFHSIVEVKNCLVEEYGKIVDGAFSFGQDLFANQFVFTGKGVAILNAETGDLDFMARDFSDWLELLSEDREYLTGVDLLRAWEVEVGKLQHDHRLCAKIPFVMGGEYKADALYAQKFPNYVSSSANIARQIHGKPDGTRVILGTTD